MLDLYRVQADWDLDSNFSHAQSLLSGVKQVEYRYGCAAPFSDVAEPGEMLVTFDNSDGRYFVENPASPLFGVVNHHALVRLQHFASGQWRTIFVGSLASVDSAPRANPPFEATFRVVDPLQELEDAEYIPPLATNARTDVVLRDMFNSAVIVHPYPSAFWLLGVSGFSNLGQTTVLFGAPTLFFDTGQTTLPFVGDNADEGYGVSAMSFARDVVAAECGGKLLFDPKANTNVSGWFRFWNRDFLASIATFTDISADILDTPAPLYRFGADIINDFQITYEPRRLGAAGSVLFSSPQPISVAASSVRETRAYYRDPNNESARIGGMNMITPLPITDYLANTASDGSGTDVTDSVQMLAEFFGSSALLTITNSTGATAYLTKLQLRGRPLSSFAVETVTARDGLSIAANGLRRRTLNLNFADSETLAQTYLNRLLARFKDPIGRIERVSLRDSALVDMYPLLGHGITCDAPGVENSTSDYAVVGVEHLLVAASDTDVLTLVLEPIL